MYEFVYRITFRGGQVVFCGEQQLLETCTDRHDDIIGVKRIEIHLQDWHEVTAATMSRLRRQGNEDRQNSGRARY